MLTFLRTSIGADSPRFQQELFTNFRDTLERPFCVLLTGKYKCTNKNTVLLQSLFNNQLPWAGALGFLLHFSIVICSLPRIRSLCHSQILEQIIESSRAVFGLEIKNLLLMMCHAVTYPSRKIWLLLLYALQQQMEFLDSLMEIHC